MHDQVMEILGRPYTAPVLVPVAFLIAGVLSKFIVNRRWTWENVYLGIEGCLAAMCTTATFITDRAYKAKMDSDFVLDPDKIYVAALLIVFVFLALLAIMAMHQDRSDSIGGRPGEGAETIRPLTPFARFLCRAKEGLKSQHFRKGILCNAIGLSLMVWSTLLFR